MSNDKSRLDPYLYKGRTYVLKHVAAQWGWTDERREYENELTKLCAERERELQFVDRRGCCHICETAHARDQKCIFPVEPYTCMYDGVSRTYLVCVPSAQYDKLRKQEPGLVHAEGVTFIRVSDEIMRRVFS